MINSLYEIVKGLPLWFMVYKSSYYILDSLLNHMSIEDIEEVFNRNYVIITFCYGDYFIYGSKYKKALLHIVEAHTEKVVAIVDKNKGILYDKHNIAGRKLR